MNLTFERKLPLLFTVVFVMLTVVGFFSYQSTVSVQEAAEWQRQSRDILVLVDGVYSGANDIEAGMQGFVILGVDLYLAPYDRGKERIARNIAALKPLVAPDAEMSAELLRLEQLANQKIADVDEKIAARRNTDFNEAVGLIAKLHGRQLMAEIRASTDRLKQLELSRLQSREAAFDRSFNRTIVILIVSSLAGIAALGVLNVIVLLEIRRRRTAEVALAEANKGLEEKVHERTRELEEANQNLAAVAEERKELLSSERDSRREAEIANRLRDEFMATVSHELRTPINSVLGWARLMREGQLSAEQMEKAVDTIIKNSETQNRLIEDLLDVAKMVSGKLQLETQEVELTDLVETSIETLRPSADAKDIALTFISTGGPSRVTGDPNRLNQIVWNLLTNAIKFTPEHGNVDVRLSSDDKFAEIEVSDTGAGIDPEFLPSVFERFRQEAAMIKKSGGLGLGLAVVRNLAEMHGGTVSAESEGVGKGSTFTVRLPLQDHSKNGGSAA